MEPGSVANPLKKPLEGVKSLVINKTEASVEDLANISNSNHLE
jgi:hypothetical protein